MTTPLTPDRSKLRVDRLTVDPEVQRAIDGKHVRSIVESFDPGAVGTISVSHRPDNTYHVVDGQHRVAALKECGLGDEEVSCDIYRDLSMAQEARLFRLLNTTKRVSPIDRFRIALQEGDPDTVRCNDIIEKNGFIAMPARKNSVNAVVAALKLCKESPHDLDRTLRVLRSMWGPVAEATDRRLLLGIGQVLVAYGDAVDLEVLIDKLGKDEGNPATFIGKARAHSSVRRIPVPDAVSDMTVRSYNRSKRTHALPEWRV